MNRDNNVRGTKLSKENVGIWAATQGRQENNQTFYWQEGRHAKILTDRQEEREAGRPEDRPLLSSS